MLQMGGIIHFILLPQVAFGWVKSQMVLMASAYLLVFPVLAGRFRRYAPRLIVRHSNYN